MKKAFLLYLLMLSIPLCACGDSPETAESEPSTSSKHFTPSFSDYAESISMPEGLSIGFDTSSVAGKTSANTYDAEFIRFSIEQLGPVLLRWDITEEIHLAEGTQYKSESGRDFEYITIYDGGESFFGHRENPTLDGGFSYTVYHDGVSGSSKCSNIIAPAPLGYGSYSSYLINPNTAQEDYATSGSLPSPDYDTTAEWLLLSLADTGLPDIEISKYFCLDLETMTEHAAISHGDFTYSEDDEGYLFFIRQTVDGIPIMDISWTGKGGTTAAGNEMLGTSISAYCTNDGFQFVRANHLYSTSLREESVPLISAHEALDKIVALFTDVILEFDYSIVSMEQIYISVPDSSAYVLRPAWVFCVAKAYNGSVVDLDCHVFDAETGEILSS